MSRLTRRQFLAGTTAAGLAPLLGAAARPVRGSPATGVAAPPPPLPLSVGYLEASDTLTDGWLEVPRRVIPVGGLAAHGLHQRFGRADHVLEVGRLAGEAVAVGGIVGVRPPPEVGRISHE